MTTRTYVTIRIVNAIVIPAIQSIAVGIRNELIETYMIFCSSVTQSHITANFADITHSVSQICIRSIRVVISLDSLRDNQALVDGIVDSRHQLIQTIEISNRISLPLYTILRCALCMHVQGRTEQLVNSIFAQAILTCIIRIPASTGVACILQVCDGICLNLKALAAILCPNLPIAFFNALVLIIYIRITAVLIKTVGKNLSTVSIISRIVEQGKSTIRNILCLVRNDGNSHTLVTQTCLSAISIAVNKPFLCLYIVNIHCVSTIQLQLNWVRECWCFNFLCLCLCSTDAGC